jgi:hypothetical protein
MNDITEAEKKLKSCCEDMSLYVEDSTADDCYYVTCFNCGKSSGGSFCFNSDAYDYIDKLVEATNRT